MPPKKLAITQKDRISFEAKLAIAANRALDAIEVTVQFLADPKLVKDLDASFAFLVCTAFREAIQPLRRCKKPTARSPATAQSVAALQLSLNIAVDWLTLIQDAQAAISMMQGAPDSQSNLELCLLLQLEALDFKRYEIEPAKILELENVSQLIKEVSKRYDHLSTIDAWESLPVGHYLRLRLCINHAIFLVEYTTDTKRAGSIAGSLLNSDSSSKLKRQASMQRSLSSADLSDVHTVSRWPVYASENARLRKKVEDIRTRYAPTVNIN
jgi:hypothetical protein